MRARGPRMAEARNDPSCRVRTLEKGQRAKALVMTHAVEGRFDRRPRLGGPTRARWRAIPPRSSTFLKCANCRPLPASSSES